MTVTEEITNYFRTACINNKLVKHTAEEKHFFRFGMSEIFDNIRSGINYPAFGLENIEGSYGDGLSDNIRNKPEIGFVIIKPCTLSDLDEQEVVQGECHKIGEQIIAKIKKDVVIGGSIIKSIDISSIRYTAVGPIFGSHYGYRFSFDCDLSAMGTIYFKPTDWDDETDYNN